jgi:signal transduction histidine kinase
VTLAAAAAALVAGVVASFLFVATLRENLEQSLGSSAASQVDTVKAQLRNGATPQQAVVSGRQDVVVQIVDAGGRVVATDHPNVTTPMRTSPGLTEGVRDPALRDRYVVVARRAATGALVLVGRSEEQVSRATDITTALLAVSVPAGVAVLALVVWLSVGRALRPVEAMRREAAAITSDRLHRRLPVPGGTDEIPRLARTLNELLDRVDASYQLQRQFVSDASHELRSPLAAMRQLAEVARRYPDRVDSQELTRDVLIEEQRMEGMVTALLTLARLDDSGSTPGTAMDLDDVVLAEVARLRDTPGPVVDASGVGAGLIAGNSVLFAQAVRNLLSNARRHASSKVVVELGHHAGSVRLVVHDDGNGIPVDQREVVLERFVRLDEARHRDSGGSGLGLAIVRKVVEGAGGRLWIDDGPLGGARVSVELPDLDTED